MAVNITANNDFLRRTTNLPASATNCTMTLWIRRATDPSWGSFSMLMGLEDAAEDSRWMLGFNSSNQLYVTVANNGSEEWSAFSSTPSANTWTFVAIQCQGTGQTDVKAYWAQPGDTSFNTHSEGDCDDFTPAFLKLGGDTNYGGTSFNGQLCYFKVWDDVLTEQELWAEMYQGQPSQWTNIHSFNPLFNVDDLVDYSGNGRTLTNTDCVTYADMPPIPFVGVPTIISKSTPDPIDITPAAAVAGADSVNPTARQGSINYGPSPVSAGADSVNPAVTLGSINLTPSPSVIVTSKSGPQVALSSMSVYPNAIAAKAARSDPLVRQGHITLDIDSATAVADGVDPTVGFSGVTATPSPAVVVASTTDPIVDDYANITPQPASAGTAVVAPTLYWGTQSASPGPASAGTMAINPQDLVMYAVTASVTTEAPIVYVGDAVIGAWPEPATSSAESVGPDLFFSSHSTTQDPAAASAVGVDPSYHVYDAPAIWPSPAVADTANAGPSVSQSSLLISPDVAECATETIEPDYFYTSMSVDPDTAEAKGATTVDVVGVFFRYFMKADINRGEYTDENDGITDIYQSIDEDPADDDDYIKSDWGPEEDKYLGKLQGVSEPDVDTTHYLEYRYRKDNNLSRVDIIVRIYQDDTVITGWTHEDIGTEYVTQRQLLAEEDAALITDYGKLRIEIEASEV